MRTLQPFTRIEAIVIALLVMLVLLGSVIPMWYPGSQGPRPTRNISQLRGIHQSLVIMAQSNNQFYAGLDQFGEPIDVNADPPYRDQSGRNIEVEGLTTEYRFQALLDDDAFTGEYAISPEEERQQWTQGSVTAANYSYTMRNISGSHERLSPTVWTANVDADQIAVSDRAINNDRKAFSRAHAIRSVHTNPADGESQWQGAVVYNDNHFAFDSEPPTEDWDDSDSYEDADDGSMFFGTHSPLVSWAGADGAVEMNP